MRKAPVRSTPLVLRLAALFAVTLVVVVGILTAYAASVARQNLDAASRNASSLVVSTRADSVRASLAGIEDDLQYVVNSTLVSSMAVPMNATTLEGIQLVLINVATRAAGRYTRLCVVSPEGLELACVERSNGQPIIALEPDLQNIAQREDFVAEQNQATKVRKQGRVVLAMTANAQVLDQAGTTLVLRYQSVVRAANAQGVRGFVVLEADLSVLFEPLQTKETDGTRFSVFESPSGKTLFGPALAKGLTEVADAIPGIANVVKGKSVATGDLATGDAIQTYVGLALSNLRWFVVGTTSLLATNQEVSRLQYAQVLIGAVSIVLGLIVVSVITRSIVQPLTRLTSTARAIALEKRYDVAFPPAQGSSEIRDLHDAFGDMLVSLSEASRRQGESERAARGYAESSRRLAELTSRIAQDGDARAVLSSFVDVFEGEAELPTASWFDVFLDQDGKISEMTMVDRMQGSEGDGARGTSGGGVRFSANDHPELVLWNGSSRAVRFIPDVEDGQGELSAASVAYSRKNGVKSLAIVPVVVPTQLAHVVIVLIWRTTLHAFSEDERRALESSASTATASVTARRALVEAQHSRHEANVRARNMELVASTGKTVASILSSQELVSRVPDLLRTTFGFSISKLYLFEEQVETLVEVDGRESVPLESPASVVARVARERGASLMDGGHEMVVSLVTGDELIGVLVLTGLDVDDPFGASDLTVQSALAQQIANSIVNARSYEESLRVAEQLKQVNRLKSEFLANISHELRTPLNAIKGYSDLWVIRIEEFMDPANVPDPEDEPPTLAGLLQPLRRISESSIRLKTLVDDLLDLGRIEAGRMEVVAGSVSLADVVRNVSEVTLGGKDASVEFRVEVDRSLPETIVTDRSKLERIVINLLSNAFKFTHSGSVTLSMKALDGTTWELRCRDTGIGIPAYALEYIFEEFRQVDGSTQRSYGGTGLGLAITRSLCRILEGGIRVESEMGHGSTFIVTLPLVVVSETISMRGGGHGA